MTPSPEIEDMARAFNAMLHEEVERSDAHVAPWARLARRHVDDWFRWDSVHLRRIGRIGRILRIQRIRRLH